MAFATASNPANRKPGATRKPQHHPKHKRDRVNRQGTPNPLRAPEPPPRARARQRAPQPPVCARAPACAGPHQRAPGPRACQNPPAHARAPRAPDPRRVPEPRACRDENLVGSLPTMFWRVEPPQRAPGQKPGSGASTEPTIGLWDANRATRRVPRALAGPSSESPRQRIVILSGLGQNKRFFAASRPKHAIICAIGKPIREQPAKSSVSHFRYREKPSVLTASDQKRRFFASRTPRAGHSAGARRQGKGGGPQGGVGRGIAAGKPPRTGGATPERGRAPARVAAPSGGTAPECGARAERGARAGVVVPRAGGHSARARVVALRAAWVAAS